MQHKYLNNKYRLERKIAQGGMSSIYLCTNVELGNKWIAKHVDKRYSGLLDEEDILKKLNHISLPRIIDICRDDSGVYIIQSYVEGESLQHKLQNLGALNVERVIDYSLQLCEVLSYLHNLKPKAIIHKDLKPSNIIITEYDKLILIDFGIAEEEGARVKGLRAGTNAYAAPEQLVNSGGSDTRVDIYSLGIVLYQMLTGQLPGKSSLSDTGGNSFINDKLLDISAACCRFLPNERYQKVEDIKSDLLMLRNKYILTKENNKIKRKVAVLFIALLSAINYICFIIALIINEG